MLLEIGLALLLAKVFGYGMEKLKQPAVVGEIAAGIFIGPFVAGQLFNIQYLTDITEDLAKLGIIFLLFISGLDIGMGEIKKAGKKGVLTSLFDVVFAFFFGFLAGQILGYDPRVSIAFANILVATSVGVTVRTLMEMRALHSNVGELILTVAVLDDILAIIVLSITLGKGDSIFLIGEITLFFIIFLITAFLITKFSRIRLAMPNLILTGAISFMLIFSAIAQHLGLAAITGAFFAGLALSNFPYRRRIIEFTRQVGEIFFIPLFFVWVGASFKLDAVLGIGVLALVLIPMAFLGKILGCSIGAKVCGFKTRDALAVGVGMMPRMEVALVVITTEMSMNIFGSESLAHQVLATTILLVIISSMITPFALKMVYKPEGDQSKPAPTD